MRVRNEMGVVVVAAHLRLVLFRAVLFLLFFLVVWDVCGLFLVCTHTQPHAHTHTRAPARAACLLACSTRSPSAVLSEGKQTLACEWVELTRVEWKRVRPLLTLVSSVWCCSGVPVFLFCPSVAPTAVFGLAF